MNFAGEAILWALAGIGLLTIGATCLFVALALMAIEAAQEDGDPFA